MKYTCYFLILLLVSCSLSGAVSSASTAHAVLAKDLLRYFSLSETTADFFVAGDFNGDGFSDLAVLFQPQPQLMASKQFTVSMPWHYLNSDASAPYRKSLAIFHGHEGAWLSAKTEIFVLLDNLGVMESPSFTLLVSHKNHADSLPVVTDNDLLILPTEAGIDTYIYWEEGGYKFFAPEELP